MADVHYGNALAALTLVATVMAGAAFWMGLVWVVLR